MNTEDFIDLIDAEYGTPNATSSHLLGSTTHIVHLELTLNLRKTKQFADDEQAYLKLYNKILHYINGQGENMHTDFEEHFFERGGLNKKLHLHSSIHLKVCGPYSPRGLLEQISRFICQSIRRKYDEKCEYYYMYQKYYSIPFTLQITSDKRILEWKDYIRKNA